jgi:hypothetical protein
MKIKNGVFALSYVSVVLLSTPSWSAPTSSTPTAPAFQLAQSDSPFYTQPQSLSPEQLKVQKYKLQRLRIQNAHRDWYITRGVNERVDEVTLLKLTGQTERLSTRQVNQSIGNTMTVSGLSLMAVGGVLLANLVKFDGSFWYGLGAFVAGGTVALVGESWANNLSELDGHVIERLEAEALIKQYNDELKKEMGVEDISDL